MENIHPLQPRGPLFLGRRAGLAGVDAARDDVGAVDAAGCDRGDALDDAAGALPGPIAPQVSAYVGYRLAGVPGAIAAAAGTVLPTTILMLALVVYFFRIKDSLLVQSMLKAVRPMVVGLLLWTAYDMAYSVFGVKRFGWGDSLTTGWDKILFVAATFGLLTMTRINPALVILGAACVGGIVYR